MSGGQFELKNGNLFVLAEAAGGVYNGSQLRLICDVADDVSVFLKVTEDQRIGFMVPKDKLLELHGKLAKSGILLKHYRNHSILSPKACLGELCPKCEQDALGDAIEISPLLNEKFKESFTALNIGINGCATACVASATDDIHVIGESGGYKILIGGRSSGEAKLAEFLIDSIPRPKIGEAICAILETYSQNKQENEALADVVVRLGLSPFQAAVQALGAGASEAPETVDSSAGSSEEGVESDSGSEEDVAAVPLTESALEEKSTEEKPAEDLDKEPSAAITEEAPLEASDIPAQPSAVEAAPEEPIDLTAESNEAAAQAETPAENAENTEESPLEVDEPSEQAEVVEEPPLEVAGAEETPLAAENESATDEPPLQDANPSEDEASVEEETMKDEQNSEEIPAAEASADSEVPQEEAKPAVEMKELDIVDDTAEAAPAVAEPAEAEASAAPPEEASGDAPQPIDHGLGEDNSVSNVGETPAAEGDDAGTIGLDEDVTPAIAPTGGNKTSIQVRGKYVIVLLSDGSDFRIPFKTIQPGKVLEMQIEDEIFIIENIDGKLQVKYGDFEMHVPLTHGSVGTEDTNEGAA